MPELNDFVGRWRLERRIDDRRAGKQGVLEGHADFRASGDHLRHEEEGTLRLDGQSPLLARRCYLWRADGTVIDVRFDDGRPFHLFDPREDEPVARHICGEDLYIVRYDFRAWPDWTATWQVAGPRKDYTLTSRFAPCKKVAPEAEIAAGQLAE